ncbi:MAG: alanine racemase [Bacteroidota bacterium]
MLGLPYHLSEIAPLMQALDLFQGEFRPGTIRHLAFDTRNISHGAETVFLALKTDHRDGHDFVQEAYEKGVRNFIVDRKLELVDVNYILVPDTLDALQKWAFCHRQRFNYPVIAITGSNGKTIVKEWLATLLELNFQIVKSPMSYNSQLGVPLSLLKMHPLADLAIIEAGISEPGEMAVLQELIQPTLGILTHMGPAHDEGFPSREAKLKEKLQLFHEVQSLLMGNEQPWVEKIVREERLPLKKVDAVIAALPLPFQSQADLENARLAILAAQEMGVPRSEIQERLPLLQAVEMRQETITDNPEITILNDSYNADPDSVRNALQFLSQIQAQPRQMVVISDIPHLGTNQNSIQKSLLEEAITLVGKENVISLGPVFGQLGQVRHFGDTDQLLRSVDYEDFRDSTVLLTGARRFELERLIPFLNPKRNASWLEIDLQALAHNFRYLKSLLADDTKSMCMVKAASYGGGTWEIAKVLEREGATYLGVAFASEGIELRKAGIRLPIMVMNPDLSSLDSLIRFELEPEVSNLDFLKRYIRAARLAGQQEYRIHLKLETGMGRLGFRKEDLPDLINVIAQHPDLNIISVLSHFAAADMPEEDEFNHFQVQRFSGLYQILQKELGLHSFRHILNTAGILRFPDYAFDMVRMGIGLYGLSPLETAVEGLAEIGSLRTRITQVKSWAKGASIGYGRSQLTERESLIATIPIGYADGIPRAVSNGKARFLVGGQRVPIFGRVCMDMIMLDVTDVPGVKAGDEVVCFGKQGEAHISVQELAEAAGTIAYEILVRISPRVRRVFIH